MEIVMIEFEAQEVATLDLQQPKIKVLGVGGAGGNAINSMVEAEFKGVEFIAINTDAQALRLSKASNALQLGIKSTKGMGTGANPELGKRAAEEDIDKIQAQLEDVDIVFLTAGLGGGTGSGVLPVVARLLKEKGILSIAIVTTPFNFEGQKRDRVAKQALEALQNEVDTLIVIPNQKLIEVVDQNVSMIDAFAMVNQMLNQSVKSIADIIGKAGHINVDFADIRTIMKGQGLALMGSGYASGPNRAREAVEQAISFPLLAHQNITGAKGVLLNITGGTDLGIHELNQAASALYEKVDADASIVVGSVIDESIKDGIYITVVATGIDPQAASLAPTIQPIMHDKDATVHESPMVELSEALSDQVQEQKLETEELELEQLAQEIKQLELQEQETKQHDEQVQAAKVEAEQLEAKQLEEAQIEAAQLAEQEMVEVKAKDGAQAILDASLELSSEGMLVDMSALDVPTALRIKQNSAQELAE
jgi:cell division protein FtsZ